MEHYDGLFSAEFAMGCVTGSFLLFNGLFLFMSLFSKKEVALLAGFHTAVLNVFV